MEGSRKFKTGFRLNEVINSSPYRHRIGGSVPAVCPPKPAPFGGACYPRHPRPTVFWCPNGAHSPLSELQTHKTRVHIVRREH